MQILISKKSCTKTLLSACLPSVLNATNKIYAVYLHHVGFIFCTMFYVDGLRKISATKISLLHEKNRYRFPTMKKKKSQIEWWWVCRQPIRRIQCRIINLLQHRHLTVLVYICITVKILQSRIIVVLFRKKNSMPNWAHSDGWRWRCLWNAHYQ